MAFFTQGKASHRCYYLVLASSSIFSGSFVKFAKFYWLNPFSKIENFLLEDLTSFTNRQKKYQDPGEN